MNQTTLTEYLVMKLTKIQKGIEYAHKELLSVAQTLNIDGIKHQAQVISNLLGDQVLLTNDAIEYLSVEDVVKYHTLMHKYTLSYGYKSGAYTSGVKTMEEAQLLKSIGVEAKIKI